MADGEVNIPYDITEDDRDDDMDRFADNDVCKECNGTGIEWDGPELCEHCDGMGYEWWW